MGAEDVFKQGGKCVDILTIPGECKSGGPPKSLTLIFPSSSNTVAWFLIISTPNSSNTSPPMDTSSLLLRSEIKDAVAITNWLRTGLSRHLPPQVKPDLEKLAIAGHSRGGKVAFGAALERIKAKAPLYSAIIGVDPVDGSWPILPESLDLKNIPALIIGSALGSEAALMFLPPCAPEGENHQKFFRDCRHPAYHFVATDYGHMDFLNDDTEGMRGLFTHCLCKKGDKREPMRSFTGGIIVAFLNASVNNSVEDFKEIFANPSLAPVKLEPPESKAVGKDVALA